MKPAHDLMNKFKKNWVLAYFKQYPIKYLSIFPLFVKLFWKVSDTTKVISCMKWVNAAFGEVPFISLQLYQIAYYIRLIGCVPSRFCMQTVWSICETRLIYDYSKDVVNCTQLYFYMYPIPFYEPFKMPYKQNGD